MKRIALLCALAATCNCATPETKTLEYKGSNYTYGGEELGTLSETEEWCRKLGGHLPSIHSPEDLYFLIHDLVGRHQEGAYFPTGATHVKRDIQNRDVWEWSDKTRLDFYDADVFKCHRIFKAAASS